MARRRSGNMGSAPSADDPFTQAATYMKYQGEINDEAKVEVTGDQDIRLAASLAAAWAQLPEDLHRKLWPQRVDPESQSLYGS
eukprot:CAMPEP_0118937790 /NCGR_PEP_ID=MMETSP1169-20130426/23838_1 /TAXON_ID=36882 /ORGANISM="Pyramimonas obovata, Strain CCMP722" /LENGTH=82 /DNA_ID=CAMNT_0006881541 /DNA_START=29 /DNA_END=277 /DNA_ORIENTATION=-